MSRSIGYNLDVAKPLFVFFIKNMNKELAQWVQYRGVEEQDGNIYFKFKSSQNSLSFKVYGGANTENKYALIRGKTDMVYRFFKDLKNESMGN